MSKIVLEDFNEGDGYYKVHLAYLSKEQVEEIETLVSKWHPTDEDIKSCIGMCLTDANEQRFKDYGTNLKDCIAWLEKQGEQKSVDKVEPKFNVGDWVIFNDKSVYKVKNIHNYEYTLQHILGGTMPLPFSSKNLIRPWTMEDAKDGDVLYSLDSKRPFIYKDRLQFSQARGYCCINKFGEFAVWYTNKCVICTDKYIPATKEQRDFLFARMKDAGYEWNAGKKELRKMEQKSDDRFDPLIDEEIDLWIKENSDIHHDNNDIVKLMRDMACYVATLTRNLYRQKSKWSYEDEANLNNIIWLCNNCLNGEETTWIPSQAEKIKHLIETIKERGLT